MPDIDLDLLKDIAVDLLIVAYIDETTLREHLECNIDGFVYMSTEEQEDLAEEVRRYLDTADVNVSWNE